MKNNITLTRENGNTITINLNKVQFIEHIKEKDAHYANSNSIIHFEGLSVFVRETEEDITFKIKAIN